MQMEDRAHETHLLPQLFGALLGRRPPLRVNGVDWPTPDGSCVRDYVHTEDLARAHELLLESLRPAELRVYNVGTGVGASVREVIAASEAVSGRAVPWEPAPRRPGDPAVLVADAGRLRRELGWEPRYPDVRAIAATAWRWHERYPDGYRSKLGTAGAPASGRTASGGVRPGA
jgi:UDP-glucose 4-epimerase